MGWPLAVVIAIAVVQLRAIIVKYLEERSQ